MISRNAAATKKLEDLMNTFSYTDENVEKAMALVRKGAEATTRDKGGYSLLHRLAQDKKNKAAVEELVSNYNVSIHIPGPEHMKLSTGLTPLEKIMNHAQFKPEEAMILVDLKADPNTKDRFGNSLLYHLVKASAKGYNYQKSIVKLINTYGVDINTLNVNDKTALQLLIEMDDVLPADPGKLSLIELLLDLRASLHLLSHRGASLLHSAADVGDIAVGKWLVEHGAKLDARNDDGEPPLFLATKHFEFFKWLVGLDINLIKALDHKQQTVLHAAAHADNRETIQYLHELSTKHPGLITASAKNKEGCTARYSSPHKYFYIYRPNEDEVREYLKRWEEKERALSRLIIELDLVDKIEALTADKAKASLPNCKEFLAAVETLVADLNMTLLEEEAKILAAAQKKKIPADYTTLRKITAGRIAIYTDALLQQLEKEPLKESKLDHLRHYENACKQTAGWKIFAKILAILCFAAVGFIIGTAIGIGIGMAAAAWSGPGAFVAAALGGAVGGVKGAVIGVAIGATVMGLSAATLSGIALFNPPKILNKVREVAQSGRAFVDPDAGSLKKTAIP